MIRKHKKVSIFTILNYLLFIIIGIIMVYPFWYVVMYSLSDSIQIKFEQSVFMASGIYSGIL